MVITDSFWENTVFVVSTIQEAEGLAILAQNNEVKYCVLLTYLQYTESDLEIMQAILARTNIKNVYILELWLLQRYFGEFFELFKKISWNSKRIQVFNNQFFGGRLFESGFNIVCNVYSPFINLIDYDRDRIYIMEHCPFDSFSMRKKHDNVVAYKEKTNIMKKMKRFFEGLFKHRNFNAVINKVRNLYLMRKYPLIFELKKVKKRFSWAIINDCNVYYLDARKYLLPVEIYNQCRSVRNENGMVLLLVDHPKQFFMEHDLYEKAKSINYIDVYRNIVKDHIKKNETIIYKMHPCIYEYLLPEEITCFQKELKNELEKIGYKDVYEFSDMFCDKIVSCFPVECFLKPLSINKIVGITSSVMDVVQDWDDNIELIEDLRFVPFMQKIWKEQYQGIPIQNRKIYM